ncbi:hypothetical protein EPN95_02220 [Patescibacteria group bacterium]|nr:MAG: hypothetical protein EPN95_02220 [Patescibacteria group bacterium]
MTNTLPTEPTSTYPTEPTEMPVVEVVDPNEAAEAAKARRKRRNKKIALGATGAVAGVGVLAGGFALVGGILRGPSQAGPTPVDTPTSESTPTSEPTAEAFDATKLDIPANATDQQIGEGYTAVITAELTGSLDGANPAKTFMDEYKAATKNNFGLTQDQFATQKATEIVDAIFKRSYIPGWKDVPHLAGQYTNSIQQLSIRIQAYLITADNPAGSVFSEQFALDSAPSVAPGASADQKIASMVIRDTNNAEAIGLRQADNSLANLNNTTTEYSITYVKSGQDLLIADFN